jgi:hypothetical protein
MIFYLIKIYEIVLGRGTAVPEELKKRESPYPI